MKEREIKLEDFRIVLNDFGLKLHEILGNVDTGRWYTISPEGVEELRNFLRQSERKEISYQDRTYLDKRKILRQLSVKDEIRNYIDIVTDYSYNYLLQGHIDIMNKYKFLENIDLYNYIKTLLVDGFLAFEMIYSQDNILIDIKPIDPSTLISSLENQKMVWFQKIGDIEKRIPDNRLIYISYSKDFDKSSMSYVEELKESYEKVRRLENELIQSRLDLPGNVNKKLKPKTILKELKRADKKLKKVSKIPKDLNMNNVITVEFDSFIKRLVGIFIEQFFNKLNQIPVIK